MFLGMLFLSLVGGASDLQSPLQLCVGDEVRIERRFDMTATGSVRCPTGIVLLTGQGAIVRASQDETVITIQVTGGARLRMYGDSIGGDRITATFAHTPGFPLWLENAQVEFERTRIRPPERQR